MYITVFYVNLYLVNIMYYTKLACLFIAHYTQIRLAIFGFCTKFPVILSNSAACYNNYHHQAK